MKNTENINNEVPDQAEGFSFKNVRSNPDVENFYRFIYENDLRQEAKLCLESIVKH